MSTFENNYLVGELTFGDPFQDCGVASHTWIANLCELHASKSKQITRWATRGSPLLGAVPLKNTVQGYLACKKQLTPLGPP
jgi:hypothetical protein